MVPLYIFAHFIEKMVAFAIYPIFLLPPYVKARLKDKLALAEATMDGLPSESAFERTSSVEPF